MLDDLIQLVGEETVEQEKAIVEALWELREISVRLDIYQWDGGRNDCVKVKTVATAANAILKRAKRKPISPRRCGYLLKRLGIEVGPRRGRGYPVWWDEGKMVGLARLFGVEGG